MLLGKERGRERGGGRERRMKRNVKENEEGVNVWRDGRGLTLKEGEKTGEIGRGWEQASEVLIDGE